MSNFELGSKSTLEGPFHDEQAPKENKGMLRILRKLEEELNLLKGIDKVASQINAELFGVRTEKADEKTSQPIPAGMIAAIEERLKDCLLCTTSIHSLINSWYKKI